jgi:hypothetical protein
MSEIKSKDKHRDESDPSIRCDYLKQSWIGFKG